MLAKINSAAINGLEASLVEVEIDISKGLPGIKIVGLPDKAVEEAKERVTSAIKNSDAKLPNKKITINLAPADIKKEGSIYDLPIAIGILAAAGQVKINLQSLFLGELSLDGRLRAIKGALPSTLMAKDSYSNIFLPEKNADEVSIVDKVNIYPVYDLNQLIRHFRKDKEIGKKPHKKIASLIDQESDKEFDIKYVKGQAQAKRALLIAAAGGHNLLLSGPPGTGKSLLAKSIPTILPKLTKNEVLEISKIYSVSGRLAESKPLITSRPFRSPHHSSSAVSVIGGGQWPKPGEITLAHRGVLFLDEFPEFNRDVLESLREPLESNKITISRARANVDFPANFILVAACNPCPCGFLTHPKKQCTCSSYQIEKYRKKLSGPILDRIDLSVEVGPVSYQKLEKKSEGPDSESYKRRVEKAYKTQENRFVDQSCQNNSMMNNKQVKKYCRLKEDQAKNLLKEAVDSLGLSARAYYSTLRVARTIADLESGGDIKSKHIAEALQYRKRDED